MKKKLLALLVIGTMSLSMTACGGSSDSGNNTASAAPEQKEYVDNITSVTSDPDACKGKYVTFYGIVSQTDESDDEYFYQVYTDTDYNNSVLLYAPKDIVTDTISSDDFISVEAKVDGSYDGQTVMGVDTTWAKLTAESIQKTTYIDSFGKADMTWNFEDQVIEQQGISVAVTKVEFAEKETRIYVTATNNSSDTVNLWTSSSKIVQDGQQYEQTYGDYLADYPELSSDILPGASSSGILCFDALEPGQLQFYLEGASDDWEVELEPFTFTLEQ